MKIENLNNTQVLSLQEDLWQMYKSWVQEHIDNINKEQQQQINGTYETIKELIAISGSLITTEVSRQAETRKLNIHPTVLEELKTVIEFLVRIIKPEKIFMIKKSLGETGSEIKFSVDLMIIIPDSNQSKFTDLEPYLDFALVAHSNISCSLHCSSRLTEAFREGNLSYLLNCTKENLIYDDENKPLPSVNFASLTEHKERAEESFYDNYMIAFAFYQEAKSCNSSEEYPLAAFMLHQAVELTCRALITSFTGTERKTHSIRSLKQHIKRISPVIDQILPDDTDAEKQLMDLLEHAYVKARYEPGFKVWQKDADLLQERVEKILDLTKEAFDFKMKLLDIAE